MEEKQISIWEEETEEEGVHRKKRKCRMRGESETPNVENESEGGNVNIKTPTEMLEKEVKSMERKQLYGIALTNCFLQAIWPRMESEGEIQHASEPSNSLNILM